jgi:hypothetical protein
MMTLFKKTISLLIALIALNGQQYGGSSAFLKKGMSARAIAMGSAFVAAVEDPSAIYWNPAGLIDAKGFQIQISDLQNNFFDFKSFGDVNTPQLALSIAFRKPLVWNINWAVGVSSAGYFVNGIDEYSENSSYLGSFSYSESATFISAAFKIKLINIGVTWKYLSQEFGGNVGFNQTNKKSLLRKPHDVGLKFHPTKYLSFGLILRDSISVGVYDQYSRNLQYGVSINLANIDNSLALPEIIFTADFLALQSSFQKLNTGIEYKYVANDNYSFLFRLGMSGILLNIDDSFGDSEEIKEISRKGSVGLGIKTKQLGIDIAWVQQLNENPYSQYMILTVGWDF